MGGSRSTSEQRRGFRLGEHWIEPGGNAVGAARVDAKAMDVLVALADAAPNVLSSEALLERVWPNVVVGDNVVHQAIAHLRAALDDRAAAPRFIEHVRRRGYRLIARIEHSAGAPAARPSSNLPAQLTSFVGRERERAEVLALIAAHRLVTLTGVGGAGKTRFALELAGHVEQQMRDGVRLVELAALGHATQVEQAVAKALALHETPGQSTHDALISALAKREMLLVLDNCEHLIDACARLVETLLHAAPGLKVLATSREALGIAGEHAWRVASLATPVSDQLPGLSELGEIEAMHLLIDRAREAEPSFALTDRNARWLARICERLDGIPLALELAAARLRALTPEQVCARLDDRFRLLTGGSRTAVPRQQTLQAAFDWSHALLDAEEQLLLRRLAVFVGGWSLAAAEAVAGDRQLPASAIVDVLTRLIDKSWLQPVSMAREGPRYRMLETVRQYASAQLAAANEAVAFRRRHCEHFRELARNTVLRLRTREQSAALRLLEAEHDNFQAALAWCEDDRASDGLELASQLWRYWMMRGLATSGRRAIERLLANTPKAEHASAARASALLGAGWMARFQGDHAAARVQLGESVALYASLGDRVGEAEALCNLASNSSYLGESHDADEALARVQDLAKRVDDAYVASYCLESIGDASASRGDHARACALLAEAVAVLRGLRHDQRLAFALGKLGNAELMRGDLAAARANLEEARALHERIGEDVGVDHALLRLGWLEHREGDDAAARPLLERSVAIAEQAGFVPEAALALSMLGRVALRQQEPDRARALLLDGLERAHRVRAQDAIASCLEGLAMVDLRGDAPVRAVELLGAAEHVRERARRPIAPVDKAEHDAAVRSARKALGKAGFASAWQRGRERAAEPALFDRLVAEETGRAPRA